MTLHEAMILVLRQQGRPLTTRELADAINHEKLYTRKDNSPLPPGQIALRAKNYPQYFDKVGSNISLAK